jgi:HD-GYP domain-containing protein (c-di-GMP phosphodiesterase class II)
VLQTPFLSGVARDVIAFHHERWDGNGYPWGTVGEKIPLAARIFAVVDSFDAMTSDRPYRKAVAPEVAFAEIQLHAGRQFEPAVVERFLRLGRRINSPQPETLSLHSTAA